jgi:predicted nucleic acid-binding protein
VTSVKVIDASALAAIMFEEPENDAVFARLHGASLAGPFLLEFELANVCATKMRRHREQRDALLKIFAMRGRFPMTFVDIDQESALRLANRHRLTAYDASYLWLALNLDAELVTLDRKLAAVAAQQRN